MGNKLTTPYATCKAILEPFSQYFLRPGIVGGIEGTCRSHVPPQVKSMARFAGLRTPILCENRIYRRARFDGVRTLLVICRIK